ncbi:MAG: acyl-CoA dehydrogenase [Planctomycetota bacterium]|nr:MAG: acyl-CoA dehydrogenase [Planctomycetota bacterium]
MSFFTAINGFLYDLPVLLSLLLAVAGFVALGFTGVSLLWWTGGTAVLLLGLAAPVWLWTVFAAFAVVFNLKPIRRNLVTKPLMKLMKAMKFLPVISETERTAIEAGTVWVDGDLFSGQPDFQKLLTEAYPDVSEDAQAFLDGPVDEVCRMVDDWDVFQKKDLSPETWKFLKENGFFGLIIPQKYGGHGFNASANSAVLSKLASRSGPLAITVMVPNSLGPAELLHLYGTQKQKDYYLPRLAKGEDIPCFALTEPNAGSDAGAIAASGEVIKGEDGQLYLKLQWEKRYITLAAVATLLGLAFKLRDPNHYLGRGTDLGITCALIPTDTPGVTLGLRHDPLGVPFYNCPTFGKDVVVPLDAIIGGAEGAGRGWQMLMECLAAGRGISLPASSAAAAKMAARISGAYATVRKQFGLSIGKFEGIEEPMARIGGFAYLMEAARRYTNGGLDGGAKPAVVTAMAKYNFTELARKAINDGMDILGGAGISRGPRNVVAHAYMATPVSITVEGANILTRTLMIFGQGAIRCHPFAYQEIKSLSEGDAETFDRAFWGHVGHVVKNGCRALGLTLSRGYLYRSPVSGPAAPYLRKLAWTSASFAFLADLAMGLLGGDLKRKETLTGRFSDIFSWMYLGTAVVRRFEAEGRRKEDEAFFHWSMQYAMARIQEGFDGLYRNLDVRGLGLVFRGPVAWWSRLNSLGGGPSDLLGHKVSRALQTPGEQRDAISYGMYLPEDPEEAMGRMEHAFRLCYEAESVIRKIKAAIRSKQLPREAPLSLVPKALESGIISALEAELVQKAEAARQDAIQVDSFTLEEYMETAVKSDSGSQSRPATGSTPVSTA